MTFLKESFARNTRPSGINRAASAMPEPILPSCPKNVRPHRGRRLTPFRQSSTAYKAAYLEQEEAGINVFIPTTSSHFEANEEVQLDHKVFHYACHRLQFTPDLDIVANSENAQVTRILSAYQMTRSCAVNAFYYYWSEEAGYTEPHDHSSPQFFENFVQNEHG